MRHPNSTWTDEEEQQLLGLAAKNLSFREMGRIMGKSWNAIAGKTRRMGLSRSERNPIPRRKAAKKKAAPCAKAPWDKPAVPAVTVTRGKPEVNRLTPAPHPSTRAARPSDSIWRPTTCQFPHGTPGTPDFHFCGQPLPNPDGRSYCPDHAARCYQARPQKAPGEGGIQSFKMHGWGGYA